MTTTVIMPGIRQIKHSNISAKKPGSANKPRKKARSKGSTATRTYEPITRPVERDAYRTALELVTRIDEDLTRGEHHYRTKAGLLIQDLDEVIRAIRDNNLGYITLPCDYAFSIPPGLAVCPHCGGRLTARFHAWALEDDGSWTGCDIEVTCASEPDLSELAELGIEKARVKWQEFMESHTDTEYMQWSLLVEWVGRWINGQYRFRVS